MSVHPTRYFLTFFRCDGIWGACDYTTHATTINGRFPARDEVRAHLVKVIAMKNQIGYADPSIELAITGIIEVTSDDLQSWHGLPPVKPAAATSADMSPSVSNSDDMNPVPTATPTNDAVSAVAIDHMAMWDRKKKRLVQEQGLVAQGRVPPDPNMRERLIDLELELDEIKVVQANEAKQSTNGMK
jgi:hypothetical protein